MLYPDVESGAAVRFRLASVVCPDIENILDKTTSTLEVTGKVVLLSDAGKERNYYAVIEVEGIATPLIVPVNQVEIYYDEVKNHVAEI